MCILLLDRGLCRRGRGLSGRTSYLFIRLDYEFNGIELDKEEKEKESTCWIRSVDRRSDSSQGPRLLGVVIRESISYLDFTLAAF